MQHETLAKKMYDTYCEAVGGKAFNGDQLPKSGEFFTDPTKTKQADAWRAAAKEPYERLLYATQCLGHPSYGHSSSTTDAIDKLRNDNFDYLQIELTNGSLIEKQ